MPVDDKAQKREIYLVVALDHHQRKHKNGSRLEAIRHRLTIFPYKR
jgi:hypothetical protein